MKYCFYISFILLLSFNANSQLNCHLKLIDDYSSKEIKLDSSFLILNSKYHIDTSNNLVSIFKHRRKHLTIKSNNYIDYKRKFNLRKRKNDTVVIRLVPNDSIIRLEMERLWTDTSKVNDTISFQNNEEATSYIMTYLKYLAGLKGKCEPSFCNHNNTYRYNLVFEVNDDQTNTLKQINKLQPQTNCEILDKYLERLKFILPKIKIAKDKTPFSLYFMIFYKNSSF